ncbi:MAG: LacI family transcriptional regulator [Cyclobacteriaceae bacterium]|nr:LacI family transcriptional regulator [Cyclobacteriaceae bacterium]
MKSRQITLKDIAKMLNVSTSTVSRALKDSHEIGAETKKQIIDLATSLDYIPNPLALGLLKNRSFTVGVLVPKIGYHYNSAAISGMEEVLDRHGYSVMICQSNESHDQEVVHVKNLVASRVDGIIASLAQSAGDYDHFMYAQKKGVPVVFFDRVPDYEKASKVIIDNEKGAITAVNHLIERGKKRIAYIAGPKNLRISAIRYRGYEKALKNHNLPIDKKLLIYCEFNQEMGYQACKKMIAEGKSFDGIFAVNDRTCAGVLAALREHNIAVPDDVAVIGFNDEPYDIFLYPSLSSIKQPAFEIGQEAARIFLSERDFDPENFTPQTKILETELIWRAST